MFIHNKKLIFIKYTNWFFLSAIIQYIAYYNQFGTDDTVFFHQTFELFKEHLFFCSNMRSSNIFLTVMGFLFSGFFPAIFILLMALFYLLDKIFPLSVKHNVLFSWMLVWMAVIMKDMYEPYRVGFFGGGTANIYNHLLPLPILLVYFISIIKPLFIQKKLTVQSFFASMPFYKHFLLYLLFMLNAFFVYRALGYFVLHHIYHIEANSQFYLPPTYFQGLGITFFIVSCIWLLCKKDPYKLGSLYFWVISFFLATLSESNFIMVSLCMLYIGIFKIKGYYKHSISYPALFIYAISLLFYGLCFTLVSQSDYRATHGNGFLFPIKILIAYFFTIGRSIGYVFRYFDWYGIFFGTLYVILFIKGIIKIVRSWKNGLKNPDYIFIGLYIIVVTAFMAVTMVDMSIDPHFSINLQRGRVSVANSYLISSMILYCIIKQSKFLKRSGMYYSTLFIFMGIVLHYMSLILPLSKNIYNTEKQVCLPKYREYKKQIILPTPPHHIILKPSWTTSINLDRKLVTDKKIIDRYAIYCRYQGYNYKAPKALKGIDVLKEDYATVFKQLNPDLP